VHRILVVLLIAVSVACGDNVTAPEPHGAPLWSDGTHLRDSLGRIAIPRGVNARVEGVFDVTFSDGRRRLEDLPTLTDADCTRMRQLGLDLLRLPINWSGIEPERDRIDEAYLRRVDDAIRCAASAGVMVIVDFHQDAYSKEIGEDGAPLWAIQPPPEQLLEGPLEDLGALRASGQVRRAFATFFEIDDSSGLKREFIDAFALVAQRYADHPWVIGFEIFNEPEVGQDQLDHFHPAAAAAARAVAPDKLVFFEPSVLRNVTDALPRALAPFPVAGAVYSPHVYTCVFQPNQTCFNNITFADLEPSVKAAQVEARSWGTPLFIGEFGCGPGSDACDRWMAGQAELHDRYLASDAFWLWKEQSQASWGLHEWDPEAKTWTERPQVVRWLSRVHLVRIAGDPARVEYDWETDRLTLELTPGSAMAAPHVVYVPERTAAYGARCDGGDVAVVRNPDTGLIEVPCSGVLEVGPR